MKVLTSLLLLVLSTGWIYSQSYYPTPTHPELFKYVPLVDEQTPEWAKLMYAEDPNVWEVDRLYRAYYQVSAFQKSVHTQNYKHWRRQIERNNYLKADGHIETPSESRRQQMESEYRSIVQQHKNLNANWEPLGPFETKADGTLNVSWQANIYVLDQSISQPDILYCGTETGGVFRSDDKGLNWYSIGEELILGGIGAVKIHPANPDIAYLAQGANIFKTSDGGGFWQTVFNMGGLDITDISINPDDPNVVLAAGTGGLFRTTDGGQNWDQIFNNRCWDIEIKPDDPNIVYVLKNNPDKKICEFFKSVDKGASFILKDPGWYSPTPGLPNQSDGGARMTVTDADPNRIYCALLGNEVSYQQDNNWIGVYMSEDGGESWSLPAGEPGGPYDANHICLSSFSPTFSWGGNYDQGYYNLGIAASDTDPDQFLVGCLSLFKTADGGASYTQWGGYGGGPGWQHPDIQDIDINGNDVWVSSDGGVNLYSPDFETHEARNNGINASDYWGFGSGWNEDVLVGGRYHNGNGAYHENYPFGEFLRLGGAESPTGYVNQGMNRMVYHSDIGGRLIPATITGDVQTIANYSLYPNESYFNETHGEVETAPHCYNHLYLGNEHNLYFSEDGGQSFKTIGTFGTNPDHRITRIEIARSIPGLIFAVQRISGQSKLWRSWDNGESWEEINLPSSNSTGGGIFLTLDPVDELQLWVAYSFGGNNTNKIFQSQDGGESWTNLTTDMLNGQHVEDICVQGGTNGGVYLATDLTVFYRNNDMSDWELFNNGAPMKLRTQTMRPFYRDSKIRVATYNRGIWESNFYEPSQMVVQMTVDKLSSFCVRDTFYFEDYSILDHEGATWEWDFPGAAWVSSTTARNPKVVYAEAGNYDVSLTISRNGESATQEIQDFISVENECAPEGIPGRALSLGSAGNDYATAAPLNVTTNNFTVSAWIKRIGDQNNVAGIFFSRGGNTTAALNFGDSNQLRYHWDGGQWWWDSGLVVPENEWTHVALVVEPTQATIYMNGIPATNVVDHAPEPFDAPITIGRDPNFNDRWFNGLIDEMAIWNKSLSQDEIRASMHLTKVPADDPELLAYYQFNREEGIITDRVGNRHATPTSNAFRVTSTGPFGAGQSQQLLVDAGGDYNFENADLELSFPEGGVIPNGEVVVSRLVVAPDQLPANAPVPEEGYWIINNYGDNDVFDELTSIRFKGLSDIDIDQPDRYELYIRPFNADGNTWSDIQDFSDATTSESIDFSEENGITVFGQLALNEGAVSSVREQAAEYSCLFPNPVRAGQGVRIAIPLSKGQIEFWDERGQLLVSEHFDGAEVISTGAFVVGTYVYRVSTEEDVFVGKLVVVE
jgi:PKD repeat protein/photosystem II stability/assembly factor-like uncharacterized protein